MVPGTQKLSGKTLATFPVGHRANSPGSTGGCCCKDASRERLLFYTGEEWWLSEALALSFTEAPPTSVELELAESGWIRVWLGAADRELGCA